MPCDIEKCIRANPRKGGATFSTLNFLNVFYSVRLKVLLGVSEIYFDLTRRVKIVLEHPMLMLVTVQKAMRSFVQLEKSNLIILSEEEQRSQ